jgi:hypothetical protein
LEALCRAGIVARKMAWNDRYEARLIHELKMISEKDFDSYFLIVADMVQFAKQHMLVGPSRGSAAGYECGNYRSFHNSLCFVLYKLVYTLYYANIRKKHKR